MYNGRYPAPSSSHVASQDNSIPQRQQTSMAQFTTASYLERSPESQGREPNPPPVPRLPPSLVTDRLNWRRDDEWEQQEMHTAINPSDFYRRVPSAQPANSSYRSAHDTESLSRGQTNPAGFYSFAVSSNFTPIPEHYQPVYTSPPQHVRQPRVSPLVLPSDGAFSF